MYLQIDWLVDWLLIVVRVVHASDRRMICSTLSTHR